jgi:arabinogalactan oligomer / maltooligosaccharide transport system substrate-binding protein
MLRKFSWRIGALAVLAAALVALVGASIAPAAGHKATAGTLRIWTDKDRKAAITAVATKWAAKSGVSLDIVQKEFGDIRSQLATVKPADAPDVIIAAHDWTGELAANGLVVPLVPKASALKAIPAYARKAFTYGKLYGMPVALENVGLFVNTAIAKVPKSWPDLEKKALAFQKKGGGRVGLAVQQGSGGDAYHMYPFFSGLCGYIFATQNGRLNPNKVGVDNKVFIKNSSMINKWNKEGLISSKITGDTATQLFTSGKAAYWVTGPWNIDTARKAGINFKIVQVPKIKCNSVPFLGVQGLMVTKFASGHGVASAAKDFVANYMAGAGPQAQLAAANNRFPANTTAGKRVTDPALKQIGLASKNGVPMPNIPQMASVWGDLGDAWVKSTKGAGATPAAQAFKTAAKNIRAKIAGG